jgi:hypothetical protein
MIKNKRNNVKYWSGVLKRKIGECHVQFLVAAIHFVFEFPFFFLFFFHLFGSLFASEVRFDSNKHTYF